MATSFELATQIEQRLLARNQVLESFFAVEAPRLAEACREMSERFLRGGRQTALPEVQGMPATGRLSFTASVTPASGPVVARALRSTCT